MKSHFKKKCKADPVLEHRDLKEGAAYSREMLFDNIDDVLAGGLFNVHSVQYLSIFTLFEKK